MANYLQQLSEHMRVADLLDVLVIALLVYSALAWFRDRASRAVAVGFALIGILFICARWLDMYVTLMLFRVGFTALLLALVVIFQDDIRRVFEHLTFRQWFGWDSQSEVDSTLVDTVAETANSLAEKRIGALLVFVGDERLERHLRGGIPLDAVISIPLLRSIFNADTPGHDGAVIVEGNRLQKLGVHLPLTNNVTAIGHGGTRHAAALGLSEKCDALVLVVSEERGTISFAERGHLESATPAQVAQRLHAWYQHHGAGKREGRFSRFTRNATLKAAALIIAGLLWYSVAYRVDTLQKTIIVPIEYRNLAAPWVIEEPRLTHAQITLNGSERAFDMLDASGLVVSFDLSIVDSESNYYLLTQGNVSNIPKELSVAQIEPQQVEIVIGRKETPTPASAPQTPVE